MSSGLGAFGLRGGGGHMFEGEVFEGEAAMCQSRLMPATEPRVTTAIGIWGYIGVILGYVGVILA